MEVGIKMDDNIDCHHLVAMLLLVTWHLVLVFKKKRGRGCECSHWWLWVVDVGVHDREVGI